MGVVDPGVFARLVRFWEEIFKTPKEVALGAEYLPNLLWSAMGALKAYENDDEDDVELKGKTGRDADVAVRLPRDALGGDDTIALLRWRASGKVGRLEELLAEDVVDAPRVRSTLRALRADLSEGLARRAMVAQLGAGEAADEAVLRGAAVVLACRNVGRFSGSQMRKLLKRSFARAVVLVLLEEHSGRVRRDPGIADELRTLEGRAVRAAAGRGGFGNRSGGENGAWDGDLFAMFPERRWRQSAYRLVALAKRLWNAELDGRARDGAAGLKETVIRLAEDRAAQRRLAREVVVRYAAFAFMGRFRAVTTGDGRGTDELLGDTATAMERALGELGVSKWHGKHAEDPESFPPTMTRSAFALSAALPLALSEACAEGWADANPNLVAGTSGLLGERLTALLAEEAGLSEPPGTEASAGNGDGGGDAETLCTTWAARRRLHRGAGEVLAGVDASLEGYLRDLPEGNPPGNATAGDLFWTSWRRNYAGGAFHSNYTPWDAVGDTRVLEGAVAEATSRFGGARGDYLVVFRVEGIRPDGMGWPMAGVTFYDPERFDYGEGRGTPDALSPADASAVSHAAVRVSASTSAEAVRSARQRLTVGLDCYSFGLSGNPVRPDFNPLVTDWEHVVNLSEDWGGLSYERAVPFQGEQSAAELDLPGMGRAYSALLAKASENPGRLTQLQDRFVRAAHWLREARFEADPAKRFVLHYIGMEHIFARGEKSDAVARRAPKLNKTWRDIGRRLTFPNMAFNRFHRTVREDADLRKLADSDERLRKWDRDERVLLNPDKVRAMLDLIPDQSKQARRDATVLIGELESLRENAGWIAEYVDHLRDLQTVKVRRLQMLRNDVVHEALYQDERMRYYAQEALEILDDALDKMVGEVTLEDPDCENIDQLIDKYDGQPWVGP